MNIKFAKLREDAVIPSKRDEDAGYDIYPCFEDNFIKLMPHETKGIPTGIISAFDMDYVAIIKERGSTGIRGMGVRAGVIDSGYRGEWFVAITNHNDVPLYISKDISDTQDEECIVYDYKKAIAQAVFLIVPKLVVEETSVEVVEKYESARGKKCLGSTNDNYSFELSDL
ncbi:MAG: dUTP pyrophosphatase [Epulopiscium sp. Nele67-Bin005]|nr:MAG: dUTP pyrophosphatase [Epulopiscium sp. Nele67-Bin005]